MEIVEATMDGMETPKRHHMPTLEDDGTVAATHNVDRVI
jgi:hypothetical protein